MLANPNSSLANLLFSILGHVVLIFTLERAGSGAKANPI